MDSSSSPDLARIRALLQQERVDEALEGALALTRREPADPALLNILGVLLYRKGRADEAVAVLGEAVRLDPLQAEARLNLGLIQQEGGRLTEAAEQFRVLALLVPQMVLAESRLGSVLHMLGNLDGAVRHMRRVTRMTPDDAGAHYVLAVSLFSRGDFAAAVEALAATLARQPDHRDGQALLGQAWLSMGETARAAAVLEPLAAVAPDHQDCRLHLERARLYAALAAEAMPAIQAAEAAAPPHAAEAAPAIRAAAGRPDGYVIRGPFSILSGYGDLAQRFVRAMAGRGPALRLVGLKGEESWHPDPPSEGARFDGPMRPRAALSFLTPPLVEPIPGVPTVNYTMFEGPRIPRFWAECNHAYHDLVVVPTESSRLAWMAAGYPEELLRVCPPGIEANPLDGGRDAGGLMGPAGRPLGDYRVRMLNISDFIARKNIDGLLRVWLRATRADDDAILILKVGKGGPHLAQDLARMMEQTVRHVGRSFDQAAPMLLLTSRLDDAAMAALYGVATHYLSLSHGEGWDLPLTRAGARGAGLIAPRHSAYTAYLDDASAHLIPCGTGPALMPYSRASYPPFHGLEWWHPDEDAAVEILSRIIRDPAAERRDPRAALTGRFTWKRAANTLLSILAEAAERGTAKGRR